MALVLDVIILLFLVHPLCALAPKKGSNLILPGSSLHSYKHPSSWASSSGHFEFGFYAQDDGLAVGIWLVSHNHSGENTVVWTANRDDPPISSNATLIFSRQGNLVLDTGSATLQKVIIDNFRSSDSAKSASMLDTGNFVFYGNKSVLWQSFDHPTDTILGGQNLSRGDSLFSSVTKSNHTTGQYCLEMKPYGNLEAFIYASAYDSSDEFWSTNTYGYPYEMLHLNEKGSLVLFGESGESGERVLVYSSRNYTSNTSIYRATLDPDGIFRIYLHQFERNNLTTLSLMWQNLNDTCDVKGRCGFNSYCSNRGTNFECYCYPGFSFINEKTKSMGCYQNFTFDGCEVRKGVKMHYNITTLEHVNWAGDSYFVMRLNKDDCKISCREDCSCGAALHSNGHCKKYSLPLKYGRRKVNLSSTAFIKLIPSPGSSPLRITDEGNESLISIMGLSLGSVAGVCLVIAISSILIYRHRLRSYRTLFSENDNLGLTEQFKLQFFSFSELDKATDGFKDDLGSGSFGTVFKGVLPDKKAIAVKKLEKLVHQGEREFRAEMTVVVRTNHKNLVRLLGFCVEGSRKFLVYEYLSKGSLANFLFNSVERPTWKERVRIAMDVAKGIIYLHEECEVCIIHCNIKPQNILFDDSMTAKISDFALGKLFRPNQTAVNTGMTKLKRTVAQYLAPEWQKNALLSVKVDVYSFGVILLELICCRNSLELRVSNADEILLPSWVYNCLVSGELNKLVEGEEVDMKMLERFVKVGLWCIQDDPNLRPLMKNVALMLEGTMGVSFPPSPSLTHSPN